MYIDYMDEARKLRSRRSTSAEAAHALRGIIGRLRRRLLTVSGESQITPAQSSALSRIARGDVSTGSALAAVERISPQAAAASLAGLESAGLIERAPDSSDGRRQVISATESGHDYVHDARDARQAWLEAAFRNDFTEIERRTVLDAISLLERILER